MPEFLQMFDETVLRRIAELLRAPLPDKLMVLYTSLGNGGAIFLLAAAVMLLFRSTRRAGVSSLSAVLLGVIVTNGILKPLVGRPRPWVIMEDFIPLVTSWDMNSFPSGHTCAAFAFAAAICAVLPNKWAKAAALIAAALMGFSRLYVGVHFPSDVLAGAVIGAACGIAGAWLVRKLTDRYHSRKAAK